MQHLGPKLQILAHQPFPIRLGSFLAAVLLGVVPIAVLRVGFPALESVVWIPLYLWLLTLLQIWNRHIRQRELWRSYGLTLSRQCWQELGQGLGLGMLGLYSMFFLEGIWGWLTWQPIAIRDLLVFGGIGLVLGLGVSLAEELLFRGWLLDELSLDYGSVWASLQAMIWFAVLHFIRPLEEILRTWPQFPGLLLVAAVLILARRCTQGRLAFPLGLHAGWIWGISLIHNLDWIRYTQQVPAWVTGIDDNPLAGLMGCGFLILTGGFVWRIQASRNSIRELH